MSNDGHGAQPSARPSTGRRRAVPPAPSATHSSHSVGAPLLGGAPTDRAFASRLNARLTPPGAQTGGVYCAPSSPGDTWTGLPGPPVGSSSQMPVAPSSSRPTAAIQRPSGDQAGAL